MPSNELHHDYSLTGLFIEAKYAKWSRRWSRYGRNGETHSTTAWQDARRRYNRAVRKASRLQLNRYQTPVEECHTVFTWEQEEDYTWGDLRTDADDWHDENIEQRFSAV